ncbi:MEMO1 family [Carpediemonas membranifera]|uniref:MEMO1 family n=1 Tax=Carpediemonas membranifera TaxID=201153 RepID=A0A8J6AXD4_9EUKA|nr:MEMO1 family [Carpediemonas membranifera]|eukprot:KAG9394850.1 MEMO1 family [Carpediemonas membranifera]
MSHLRPASHAGTWYSGNPQHLRTEIDTYFSECGVKPIENSIAVIVPHAGYTYSAPTAAYSFASIPTDGIERVVVLGPSHVAHIQMAGVADDSFDGWETLFGPIPFDTEVYNKLKEVRGIEKLSPRAFVAEHSLEMQMPFIRTIFGAKDIKLVPIVVGGGLPSAAIDLLADLAADGKTFFVISSDFCHWGDRFGYNYLPDHTVPIHEAIESMDREAVDLIATGDVAEFEAYLHRTGNTICGRYPIATLMRVLKKAGIEYNMSLLHYDQSERLTSRHGASVSYVAANFARKM